MNVQVSPCACKHHAPNMIRTVTRLITPRKHNQYPHLTPLEAWRNIHYWFQNKYPWISQHFILMWHHNGCMLTSSCRNTSSLGLAVSWESTLEIPSSGLRNNCARWKPFSLQFWAILLTWPAPSVGAYLIYVVVYHCYHSTRRHGILILAVLIVVDCDAAHSTVYRPRLRSLSCKCLFLKRQQMSCPYINSYYLIL